MISAVRHGSAIWMALLLTLVCATVAPAQDGSSIRFTQPKVRGEQPSLAPAEAPPLAPATKKFVPPGAPGGSLRSELDQLSAGELEALLPGEDWGDVPPAAPSPAANSPATTPMPETAAAEPDEETPPVTVPPPPTDAAPLNVPIETAQFNGVQPGVSTVQELEQEWGATDQTEQITGGERRYYDVEPFEHVAVDVIDGQVAAITISLESSFPPEELARELGLDDVEPTLILAADGLELGQAFPERGVLFAFDPEAEQLLVLQVILERISPEAFLARSQSRQQTNLEGALADAEQVLSMQPNNYQARLERSRALAAMGRLSDALTAARHAAEADAQGLEAHLEMVRIEQRLGHLEKALARCKTLAGRGAPAVDVQVQLLMGELLARGPGRDYREAIKWHQKAIETAESLLRAPDLQTRQIATRVLLEAHLGVAHDVAWGAWQRKQLVVPMWISRSEEIVSALELDPRTRLDYQLQVAAAALTTYGSIPQDVDPTAMVEQLVRCGSELIELIEDPHLEQQVRWQMGQGLYDALQICQMRGELDSALEYGNEAIEQLELASSYFREEAETPYLLGRAYFRMGSLYALHQQRHDVAVRWFEKAIIRLQEPLPLVAQRELGRHGESFVSMAVSYWETGQQEAAVELTTHGMQLMQQAVEAKLLDPEALTVPYGNLASMHAHLGNTPEATQYEQLAAGKEDTLRR